MKKMICVVMLVSMLIPCVTGAAEKSKSKPKLEQTQISKEFASGDDFYHQVEVITSRIVDRENAVVCYKMYSSSPEAGRGVDGGYPMVAISCVPIMEEDHD